MAKTKTQLWFDENVSENQKELLEIGELANKVLHETISISINNPKTTIAIYAKLFECICDVIIEKESEWSDFRLNVADRLNIGYTTTSNEDDEKMGNFMIYIQDIDHVQSTENLEEDETDTIVLCTQWNAANVKAQSDVIKKVASAGKKVLSEILNVKTESNEIVIPMFCIIHDQILNYIRLKKAESKDAEYEINVAGLYTIGIADLESEDEDEEGNTEKDINEEIYYVPSISLKLRFKSDKIATGKDE